MLEENLIVLTKETMESTIKIRNHEAREEAWGKFCFCFLYVS